MPETHPKSSQRRDSDATLPEEVAPQRKNSMVEADIEDKREPENPATAVLWEGGDKDKAGLRFGPKAAAHLKVRKYQESLVNKEVTVGSLWVDRPALVMLMPDLRTVRCRDTLLAAALMQAHLHKTDVKLCLIFPTKNPRFAQDCAVDFALTLPNVEIYVDNSKDFEVFQAFGCHHAPRDQRRTMSQKLEALGYYTLRAWCGPAHHPVCLVSGFGCSHTSDFLGATFLLGPGDKMRYRCMDEDGEMLVDTNTILQLCTKVAVHTHNAGSSMIFVSV